MLVRLTRFIALLLSCTLFSTQLAQATTKTPTPADMYKKIEKAKLNTCITIKEADGTELAGRILMITPDNFTLQPTATVQPIVISYADLVSVKAPSAKAAWIVMGSVLALGIGGGFLLHHEYENSLANQKASQDAFCTANHIPLSECAGG